MHWSIRWVFSAVALLLVGCTPFRRCETNADCSASQSCNQSVCVSFFVPTDGGAVDQRATDAGATDAGATDVELSDAGLSDAGLSDAGNEYWCGDSVLSDGEDCDDGNTAPADGCSASCQVENGFCCIPGVGCVQTGAQPDVADASSPAGTPMKNVCQTCLPGASKTSWTAVQGSCDDGLFCTGAEMCRSGVCVHAGNACVNPTPYCDEGGDVCVACRSAADCDDGNGCTDEVCNGGSCVHANNVAPCDDGLWCNGADTCGGGTCSVHAERTCGGGTPLCSETLDACVACLDDAQCNDQEVCTTDACVTGLCEHEANALSCDDAVYCNGADTCARGACLVHAGLPCEAGKLCDENKDRCVQCIDASQCSQDSSYCNGNEYCALDGTCGHTGSPCQGATPHCVESSKSCVGCLTNADCDDGYIWTTHSCGPANVCIRTTCPSDYWDCDNNASNGCESYETHGNWACCEVFGDC